MTAQNHSAETRLLTAAGLVIVAAAAVSGGLHGFGVRKLAPRH